ncbi:DNA modification methylase [Bradyrhizobium sp. AUGA SZCCT0169]|uniref:DNA modification methylase n=1 Tax=Bradyrhizobium sp. AUGA SZCCT0169 TaxID=2807663 RepID=UPI001BAE336D|nr:DNA modification methylase [Bradyrhizobium sp. AUGA SZCCT0169]MBR1249301.1 DNA modification methylase [Bradyrhizobium sp. AUGA SZCCT0169]
MTNLHNSRTTAMVSIDDLKPYDNNPLIYPRKQLRKIEALIRRHDQIPTILVTSDLTIIGGEEWWQALKNAGKTEVKVDILADLSPAEANAVRLALGRLPLDAKLDRDRLGAELTALQAQGIDLDLTAFDQAEIDFSLELDMPRANVAETIDVSATRADVAVSKPGDIFQLGSHRVGCGDARDQGLVDLLREGRQASVCITDPPFNLKFSGFGFGKSRHRHGDFVEASGEMSELEFYALIHDALQVMRSSSSPSALIFTIMDWRHFLELTAAGKQLGLALLNVCVWVKPNGGLGGLYRSQHELVAVFKAGSGPHRNNVELGKFGRNRSNVWEYAVPSVQDALLGSHPTVKPVAMLADILRDCTKRGDLVIDTFLGSGSTLIAAEETGRACVGTELDPYYLDVVIRRWQSITGREAVHLRTGQRFDDMAQRLLPGVRHGG